MSTQKIKNKLIFFLVKFIGSYKINTLQKLGLCLGYVYSKISTKTKKVVSRNLEVINIEPDYKKRKVLVKKNIINMFITGFEMVFFLTNTEEKCLEQIKNIYGLAELKKEFAKNKGLMLVGPHFGAWELTGLHASSVFQLSTLYTISKKPYLEKMFEQGRTKLGAEMSPANSIGVKSLIKAIKNKKAIALLCDQVPNVSGGEYIPFFGKDALTMSFAGTIYKKYQVPVFVSFCVRRKLGDGFDIYYENIANYLLATKKNIKDEKIAFMTAMNNAFEDVINKHGHEQYQWSYKRFKNQKISDKSIYK